MKKLSIIVVTTSFPIEADGREAAGSFVMDFCDALGAESDLTVIAPASEACDRKFPHFKLRCFRAPQLPLSLLRPTNPRDWLSILATLRAGQARLDNICGNEKIDHIFCLWALPCGYWARNMKKRYGVPYSTWALGSDIWTLGRIPLVKNVLRSVLQDSRHNYADGMQLKNDVERISGSACAFLPSARRLFDQPAVRKYGDCPPYKIAFLGRWHPNKGVDLLGQALEQLGDEAWARTAAVRIAGGGPLEPLVKDLVAQLRQKNKPVSLEGYKNREEAQELLQWADFIVIPSRIESIPVIFSDAMQAGCAVIASPVGDLPQLIAKYEVGIASRSTLPSDLAVALTSALKQGPGVYSGGIMRATSDFRIEHIASRLHADLVTG